jgi:hypothetical protein
MVKNKEAEFHGGICGLKEEEEEERGRGAVTTAALRY